MYKPVACCMAAGLLALTVACCGKYVGEAALSENVKPPKALHAPSIRHDSHWIPGLLSPITLNGSFPGESTMHSAVESPSVGSYFAKIGKRSTFRYSEWQESLQQEADAGILPKLSTPRPEWKSISLPDVSAVTDSDSTAILQKYASDRLNYSIRLGLLKARLANAESWERDTIKQQIDSVSAKLDALNTACDAELKAHADAVKKVQAEAAESETDEPAACATSKQTAVPTNALPVSTPESIDGGWGAKPITAPPDVTSSLEFKNRVADTEESINRAIRTLNESVTGKTHASRAAKNQRNARGA